MIERLIELCARNRFIVLVLTGVAVSLAVYSMRNVPLDAIPDLSDVQVIIYSRWDRSPDLVEAQVTYPIVSAMLGAPHVRAVRGFSDFGYSFIYVIFEDGTDIYWARTRTLEYLSGVLPRLPRHSPPARAAARCWPATTWPRWRSRCAVWPPGSPPDTPPTTSSTSSTGCSTRPTTW